MNYDRCEINLFSFYDEMERNPKDYVRICHEFSWMQDSYEFKGLGKIKDQAFSGPGKRYI